MSEVTEITYVPKKLDIKLKAKFWAAYTQQPYYEEGRIPKFTEVRQILNTSSIDKKWKSELFKEWFLDNNTGIAKLFAERDNMINNLIAITQGDGKDSDKLKAMSMAFDLMNMGKKPKPIIKMIDSGIDKMEEHEIEAELQRIEDARKKKTDIGD